MKNMIGHIALGLIWLLGKQTYALSHWLGTKLGAVLLYKRTRAREVAKLNIKLCYPQKTDEEREALLTSTMIENGKLLFEIGLVWGWPIDKVKKLIQHTHEQSILEEALAENNGVVLLAIHHANWEILNHAIQGLSINTAIYRPSKLAPLDRWMYKTRSKLGIKLVPTTRKGVEELHCCLARKEMVSILPDQEPSLKSGEFAPFMGMQALTSKLVYDLLQHSSAKVVFVYSQRLIDGSGFSVHYKKAEEEIYSDNVLVSQTAMNKTIESCFQAYPEQFEWTYKRFRHQPNGGNLYDEAGVP
jgi:KDO2-lipid IV(A) lauroyltransferase